MLIDEVQKLNKGRLTSLALVGGIEPQNIKNKFLIFCKNQDSNLSWEKAWYMFKSYMKVRKCCNE